MAYIIIALLYVLLIPMWGVASNMLSAPSTAEFYGGILLIAGMLVYAVLVTKMLVKHVTYDLS